MIDKKLIGIIALSNNGVIGKNGVLPWHCPEDLKHFKDLTHRSSVLVGWRTLQTLPVLSGRTVIEDRPETFGIINNILKYNTIFVIGGKATYEKYCPYFSILHVSHVNVDVEDGDTLYPDFSNINPKCKIIDYYFNINS